MKLPTTVHEEGMWYFVREIQEVISAIGLKRDPKLLDAMTVNEQGVSKEPDSSFHPSNLQGPVCVQYYLLHGGLVIWACGLAAPLYLERERRHHKDVVLQILYIYCISV